MKRVVVTQWVRAGTAPIPPDERLASRSGANPRASPQGGVRSRVERGGRPCDGAPKSVESWTTGYCSKSYRGERRRFPVAGRQQSWAPYGECRGHHRGLRAGHACRGVTWELGRTTCLLATCPERGTGRPKALAWPGGFHQVASPCGTPRTPRQHARYREASDERSNPRRAGRESERSIVPAKVGNRGPRDPREGRRRRASREAGEQDGRDLESTNRHTTTPVHGSAGRPRGRSCVSHVGPPDRRRRPSGGIPPHAHVERSGHRWGDGEAVCRTPRRTPARPARASTPWVLPRSEERARVAREGRWGPAPDGETDVRGQDGPESGSEAVGSDLRAGLSGQLLWLSAGTQPPRGTARTTRAEPDGGHRLARGGRGQWRL